MLSTDGIVKCLINFSASKQFKGNEWKWKEIIFMLAYR